MPPPSLMCCYRELRRRVLERTLLQTDYIDERCAPKVNSKNPAVDQGITTTPTKSH